MSNYLCNTSSKDNLNKDSIFDDKNKIHKELEELCSICKDCSLHNNRINSVFYRGNLDAKILWSAEAPGSKENDFDAPLVGDTGTYLNNHVVEVDLFKDSYFCNIQKCWPGLGNPDPTPEQKEACKPWLLKQIELIKPNLIISIGRHTFSALMPSIKLKITQDHGKIYTYLHMYNKTPNIITVEIPIIPILHPSYVLRQVKMGNTSIENEYKRDFLKIERIYREMES